MDSDDNNPTNDDAQEQPTNDIPQQAPPPPPQPQPPPIHQQQTIVHVRDRLFHALFYRLALMYARKFPKLLRRLIEFFVLLLALSSFGLLSYLHVVFNRNPINCLAPIQDKWPRDGILRVEIVHNASTYYIMSYDTPTVLLNHNDQNDYIVNYSLRESYEKEYSNSMIDLFSSYLNADELKSSNNDVEPIDIETLELILNSSIVVPEVETNVTINDTVTIDTFEQTDLEDDIKPITLSTDSNITQINNETIIKEDNQALNVSVGTPVAYAPKLSVENHKKEIPTSTIEKMSPAYRLIKEAFSELQLISRVCKLILITSDISKKLFKFNFS